MKHWLLLLAVLLGAVLPRPLRQSSCAAFPPQPLAPRSAPLEAGQACEEVRGAGDERGVGANGGSPSAGCGAPQASTWGGLSSLLLLDFLCRVDYLVPEDFSAPLELPQPHFGLVDDYGIKPKQLHFRTWATRAQPAGLRSAGKSKRDELDMSEYYYDDHL
ncbi:uncharacterized protein C11orf94 homolog isoform X2 [Apteryx rowi]|uniref:uncharacterized protein C11orf94 homolog isoform X2 n=1 Tax=Apteryx rowi TaxID=308060 RepID=UPI000E1C4DE1|nr:uncharacterized protein C11orf94 homolog isoform X2 [Apteryx rowi]